MGDRENTTHNEKCILENYYEGLNQSFHTNLAKCQQDSNKKNIHQLRLSIKQLKAFWSLLDMINTNDWSNKDHITLVSKLYKAAGKVRESQINLKLIGKLESHETNPLKIFLTEKLKKSESSFSLELKTFDAKKFEKLNTALKIQILNTTDSIIHFESISFLHKQTNYILQLQKSLPDLKSLHQIRIQLKALNEILSIFNELGIIPKSKTEEANSIKKNIVSINSQIGEWHDYLMLNNSLNDYMETIINPKTKQHTFEVNSYFNELQQEKQHSIHKLLTQSQDDLKTLKTINITHHE